jgi:phosphoribosylformimino-5-aminoimidazole carboxamide ribotide isomerase
LDGQAVRLYKGDYAQKTVYSQNPPELAEAFEEMGAMYLHVVDLDGAKSGNTINIETIRKIREKIAVPIQVGGGIRSAETVSLYLDEVGIDRVILGTIAAKQPEFVGQMLKKYGCERIVVGVDVKNGSVAISGWTQDSQLNYLSFIGQLKELGTRYVVATDISRDGTLTSPNWEMYDKIKDIDINVIVSGGIGGNADIEKASGYYGVIVGKAYYEGKVDLKQCLKKESFPA